MTRETQRPLLFVCALGLVVSAFMFEWLVDVPMTAGLWGAEICDYGCHSHRWDEIRGAQFDVYLAGYAAFALSLVGTVMLVLVGLGKASLSRATRKVLLATSIAMGFFVLDAVVIHGAGPGFMILVGLGAAISGQFLLRKRS